MRTKLRATATTALEVTGFGVIDAGIWLIWAPAGVIATGLSMIAVGVLSA